MDGGLFDAAADAVVTGDEAGLKALLAEHPALIRARSSVHGATLLHYVAANGVEDVRQKTPLNAPAILSLLLEAGADANATAEFYGRAASTLCLLVSSAHPHQAGLQAQLAEQLLDAGAHGEDALETALASGYSDTAQHLAKRLPVDSLPVAAGLGLTDRFEALLPQASAKDRHKAVALAAVHGHVAILERLTDEDFDRFNPEGFHSHSTPLHQAALAGQMGVVRWLVEHGARTDIADAMFHGTALGWARHGGQDAVAAYLAAL